MANTDRNYTLCVFTLWCTLMKCKCCPKHKLLVERNNKLLKPFWAPPLFYTWSVLIWCSMQQRTTVPVFFMLSVYLINRPMNVRKWSDRSVWFAVTRSYLFKFLFPARLQPLVSLLRAIVWITVSESGVFICGKSFCLLCFFIVCFGFESEKKQTRTL